MEKVRKTLCNNIEILVVDYSDCKGKELIEIFEAARNLALAEGKPVRVLNIFNDKTFLNPEFMRHVEREVKKVDYLVVKQAIIGLSKIQGWILKGVNLWYEKQIQKCDSMDEALRYLVEPVNT